jgi:hypothetical protein
MAFERYFEEFEPGQVFSIIGPDELFPTRTTPGSRCWPLISTRCTLTRTMARKRSMDDPSKHSIAGGVPGLSS